MDWARTLRIDVPLTSPLEDRLSSALHAEGVRLRFAPPSSVARTYVLVEGTQSVDAAELCGRVRDGRWYDEAIIALAIEPAPPDALRPLAQALGGPGAPAGVISAETIDGRLVVEFRPLVTQSRLLMRIVDVELRRFNGTRRTVCLTPVPVGILARVAAEGLQAPEIAPDRILESLLGIAHVE